jgi:uncharacterized protein
VNTTSNLRQTVERFLQAAVSSTPGDMADYYGEKVIIEMPFAVDALYPARIETTRAELRARFQAGSASRRYTELEYAEIHETADSDVVIVEYRLKGEMVSTAEPFVMSFVMVLRFSDGRIVHSRDYTDPVVGARVLGRIPELIGVLSKAGPK